MQVPTTACRMPPLSKPSLGPTPLMSWKKKFGCMSTRQPREATKMIAEETATTTTSAVPVTTDSATRSLTSTRPPLIAAVTAVTAIPSTNHAIRNHGIPSRGSSRWVTSQARPRPPTQLPIRAKRSSGVGLPRAARGTGGGASSSYVGRLVVAVATTDSGGTVVVMRRSRHRSGCG